MDQTNPFNSHINALIHESLDTRNNIYKGANHKPTRMQNISLGIKNLRNVLPLKERRLSQGNILKWAIYYIKFLQSQSPRRDDNRFMEWMLITYLDTRCDFASDQLSFCLHTMNDVETVKTLIPNLRGAYSRGLNNSHAAVMAVDQHYLTLAHGAVGWLGAPEDFLHEYQNARMAKILELAQQFSEDKTTATAMESIIEIKAIQQ